MEVAAATEVGLELVELVEIDPFPLFHALVESLAFGFPLTLDAMDVFGVSALMDGCAGAGAWIDAKDAYDDDDGDVDDGNGVAREGAAVDEADDDTLVL